MGLVGGSLRSELEARRYPNRQRYAAKVQAGTQCVDGDPTSARATVRFVRSLRSENWRDERGPVSHVLPVEPRRYDHRYRELRHSVPRVDGQQRYRRPRTASGQIDQSM